MSLTYLMTYGRREPDRQVEKNLNPVSLRAPTIVAQPTPGHARRRRLSGPHQRDLATWAVPFPRLQGG